MFASSMLDIALGIVFVFVLLSLLASTINEILLSLLNMRGREQLRGIKMLLDDEHTGLVTKLYNHGQIFGLFDGAFDPKKTRKLPSYVPTENFVMAMLDVVADGHPEAATTLASLKTAAEKLASSSATEKVGKPLVSIINAAGNSIEKVKDGVANWYNSAMERVSGRYKWQTQFTILGIGLVLSIALNADTLRIVRQLSRDSTVRESIVAAAQASRPPENNNQSIKNQIEQIHSEVASIQSLGIPLGWADKSWQPSTSREWVKAFGGWLLTAVAISLGAPFWFDILNRIMLLRSTVKPGEKGKEESQEKGATLVPYVRTRSKAA